MTDDTVTAKLAEWETLVDGATEGPWRGAVVARYTDDDGHERGKGAIYPGVEPGRAAVFLTPDWLVSDAEFIAAARTAMPVLIAAVQGVLTLIDEDHCPGGCEHDAIDAEVLGDRIKRALMEQIGGHL